MRRTAIIASVLVLGLAAALLLAPRLVATDWARERITNTIETRTGRQASLAGLAFSWRDGLAVEELRIAQRTDAPDALREAGPLIDLPRLGLDVGLGALLDRRLEVDSLRVRDPAVVLGRAPDGSLSVGDLLETPADGRPDPAPPAGNDGSGTPAPVAADFEVTGGSLTWIDLPYATRVVLDELDLDGSWDAGRLESQARARLNGGAVALDGLRARLGSAPASMRVERLSVEGAALDATLPQLGFIVPFLGESARRVTGTLDLEVTELGADGLDRASLERSATGSGTLRLEGGTIVGGAAARLLDALEAAGVGDVAGALGTTDGSLEVKLLTARFRIEDGRVHTDETVLEAAGASLRLEGSTGLDGSLDHRIVVDRLDEVIERNPELARYLSDADQLPLTLTGDLADPRIGVDLGGALRGAVEGAVDRAVEEGLGVDLGDAVDGLLGDD